jgi:hypothetical protein
MAPAPWPKAIQIWAMIPSCVYAMISLLGQNRPLVDRRDIGEQGISS